MTMPRHMTTTDRIYGPSLRARATWIDAQGNEYWQDISSDVADLVEHASWVFEHHDTPSVAYYAPDGSWRAVDAYERGDNNEPVKSL